MPGDAKLALRTAEMAEAPATKRGAPQEQPERPQLPIDTPNALLIRNTQTNHADIAQHVTAVNRGFESPTIAQFWNPLTAAGRAALDAMITQQAQIIAYIDEYKLLMIATLAVIPLLLVFKKTSGGSPDHTLAVE
jgi:DHA2 family multidrug resistance protein